MSRLDWLIAEPLPGGGGVYAVDNAFCDGMLKTTGMDIDGMMPPMSRFGGDRAGKKQGIIEKLMVFFEKYLGIF